MVKSDMELLGRRLQRLNTILKGGKGSGNFGHTGRPGKRGGSGGLSKVSGRRLPQKDRVWQGSQQEKRAKKLSKLETGEIGEKIAMQALSDVIGTPFTTLNKGINNAPIDVIGNHSAIEVKAGLSTNGRSSQHWRATIGQPGKKEQKALKNMTKKEKRAHNNKKKQAILDRKDAYLQKLSAEAGKKMKGRTMTVILSPSGDRGDVFMFDGFHLRLPWKTNATEENYIGTYMVEL